MYIQILIVLQKMFCIFGAAILFLPTVNDCYNVEEMTDSDKLKAESSNLAEYLSKASESLKLVEDLKKTVEIDNQEYILSSFYIHSAKKF